MKEHFPTIVTVAGFAIVQLLVGAWYASSLHSDVKANTEWRNKFEPIIVSNARASERMTIKMDNLKEVLDKIENRIDYLYETERKKNGNH